ncbi:hypothetical protein VE01_09468 [Pseudogymnoascus verrucosus]|uniref:Uncharacterized protein n=1 Tax=Pseudogymnoascus verrucosus TaxID=342668 RepID=A0A1B8G9M4_9PEZI|nr:uncharacterized protein VE01_09468 [Pseudogymnoascus verrucosus]OBT92539.2 hypothetical protein VE01_09468 [Pseudogymnoascus verrucosus]
MPSILVSDPKGDNRSCPEEAAKRKRPYSVFREIPNWDDNLPRKKPRLSSHIGGSFSRLPPEILSQIISEIIDRRTLLSVGQVEAFKGFLNMDSFRSAYTEEVRRGEYTSDNAIDTITKHIKEHQEAALMIFEVTWKGMIREGQLKGAVSFLNRLSHGLDEEDFDTVLLSLRIMYDDIVLETSWEAWAAAFTAADFLHEEYRNDDTIKMIRRIRHGAVSKRQQILGQSASNGQWSNAYLVLNQLQRYYELEKRMNFHHLEAKQFERTKKLNDDLAEVLHVTLNLAVQEHQWVEASNQVFELVKLNADIHSLVRILETICSGAISEDRWQDATETVRVFKYIPDYENVAEESLDRLRSQWYRAEGIRWTYGNTVF